MALCKPSQIFLARSIIDHAEQSLNDPDPWSGFRAHVTFLCRLQATDRGLADLLTTQVTAAPELEDLRAEAYRRFVRVADRAGTAVPCVPTSSPNTS